MTGGVLRLGVDGGALDSSRGGDETSLRGMLAGLAAVAGPGLDVRVYSRRAEGLPDPPTGGPRFRHVRLPGAPGLARLGLLLPWRLAFDRPRLDAFLALTHAPLATGVPCILQVADLSFRHHPDQYPGSTRRRLELLIGRQVRSAALVITVSDFCRRDLIETYGLPGAAVRVVSNPIVVPPPLNRQRTAAARGWLAERDVVPPYVLYLGNVHPRKNVPRLIDAFDAIRGHLPQHRLVIAGGRWWGPDIDRLGGPSPLRAVGRVPDDVREVLLREADVLVYPSSFEGFGLPPLEAMARGTPVVASDRSAIPEVCGDAAVLVDPTDVDALAGAIRDVVGDDELRRGLIERGRRRAGTYSVQRTGRELLAALHAVVDPDAASSAAVR